MAKTYEIIEAGGAKSLTMTDGAIVSSVGIDLKNSDYQDFLAWAPAQQPPVTLPEGWPTL